jgi:hypothetical protein
MTKRYIKMSLSKKQWVAILISTPHQRLPVTIKKIIHNYKGVNSLREFNPKHQSYKIHEAKTAK